MCDEIKRIDIKEFCDLGFLQEANRLFFHPLGLALEASLEWPEDITEEEKKKYDNKIFEHPNAVWSLGGVWDCRDDPEGMLFGKGMIQESKILRIQNLLQSKIAIRSKLPECNENGIQKYEKLNEDKIPKVLEKDLEDDSK